MSDGQESRIVRFITRHETVWFVLLALAVALALSNDRFLTTTNLVNILRQVSIVGLLALGMTLVLLGGHFDLSVGSTMLVAAVCAILLQPVSLGSTVIAVALPLVIGAAVGACNGLAVGGLGANSIVVTVGMQFAMRGAVLVLAQGQHVRVDGAAPAFVSLAEGTLFGLPVPVLLLVTGVVILHVVVRATVFGRYVQACGANRKAANLSGVPVARSIALTFVISGVLAAASGVLIAARVRNLDPTSLVGYEFSALTAVVLGGAQLTGGRASIISTLAGVIVLGMVANAMTLLDWPYHAQLLAQGVILVSAVALDAFRRGADA